MDEQLVKYIIGEANVLRADCLISREKLNGKMDYVYVEGYENGIQYYQGPQKRKPFRINPNGDFEEIQEPLIEEKKSTKKPTKKKGNGTGGKLAYAKVYTSRLLEMPREQLSFELLGICLYLSSYAEWETGFLIIGRGKNRRNMAQKDIAKVLQLSLRTTSNAIKRLRDLEIIIYSEDGYRLSPKYVAKGRVFDADKIR